MFEPSASDSAREQDCGWFVYVLATTDCSTFKVGFSANPLQRTHCFSSRYYERFDLHQSLVLRLAGCADARRQEAALKAALAGHRMDAPHWIPPDAGGHTEWFSAVQFGIAEQALRARVAHDRDAQLLSAFEFFRGELQRFVGSFEPWACDTARRLCDDFVSTGLGYEPTIRSRPLRDWINAYEFFDLPIFKDDPGALNFVVNSARLSA